MTTFLVTGAAGFVGAALSRRLLDAGHDVVGLDNLDPYYDPALKLARLERLRGTGFTFVPGDVADWERTLATFEQHDPEVVVHLAAQAGVRHALTHPRPYARTNLMGFVHVAEAARATNVAHMVYASSSSVYGETAPTPFDVRSPADHPVSLYAATKRANELLAHSYAHVYGLPMTGLRFFTVYGPWGRPDMAYYSFARRMSRGEPITVFGDGSALRDFTYIDDITAAIERLVDLVPKHDPTWSTDTATPATSAAPYRLFNIGRGQQVRLSRLIELLEEGLGVEAVIERAEPQKGDVPQTHAEVDDLYRAIDRRPEVSIEEGIARFVAWFRDYEGHGAA